MKIFIARSCSFLKYSIALFNTCSKVLRKYHDNFYSSFSTMQIKHRFLPSTDSFFQETTTNYRHEKRNNTTESTEKSFFFEVQSISLYNYYRYFHLYCFVGSYGYQLRSRIILYCQATSYQQNTFCENANVYEEANNVH